MGSIGHKTTFDLFFKERKKLKFDEQQQQHLKDLDNKVIEAERFR